MWTCAFVIALRVLRTAIAGGDIFYTFKLWFFASLYGSGGIIPDLFGKIGIPMHFIGAVWFLLALFFGKIILMYISKTKSPFIFAIIISYIGYATAVYIWLPFSFQAGLHCVIYLYIGYYIKCNNLFQSNSVPVLGKITMAIVWAICIVYGGRLYLVNNFYGNGLLDLIGSVCGTFVIIYISQFIQRYLRLSNRLFSSLGRISLSLLCGHLIAINCWPIDETSLYLMQFVSLPMWVFNVIVTIAMSFLVTLFIYFVPYVNRFFFSNSKISLFYQSTFLRKKTN